MRLPARARRAAGPSDEETTTQAPDHQARAAAAMRRARLVGVGFTVVQFGVYTPPEHALNVSYPLIGAVIAAALLAVNAVSARAYRPGRERRAALPYVEIGCDTLIVLGIVWCFAFQADDSLWVLLLLPILESAWRLGLPGTMSVGVVVSLGIVARDVAAARLYEHLAVWVDSLVFRSGVLMIHSTVAALLARERAEAIDAYQRAWRGAARHVARLRTVVGAHRERPHETFDGQVERIARAVVDLGFAGALIAREGAGPGPGGAPELLAVAARGASAPASPEAGLAQRALAAVREETGPVASCEVGGGSALAVDAGGGTVLAALREPGQQVEEGQRETLVLLAAQLRALLERRQADEDLAYQARHDYLTGLPNRQQFLERLESALRGLRDRCWVAVLFCDIDGFKLLNDTAGHETGDALLRAAGQRLRRELADEGLVARFGGDEFIVLVEEVSGEEHALAVADRLQRVLAQPFDLAHHRARVAASIGLTLGGPNDDPLRLLRDADLAMYEAKREGRGRVTRFTAAMGAELHHRRNLEAALPEALAQGQMSAVFQPIVGLPGRTVVGVEALARWRHPQWGPVPPSEFIPLAEETGFIVPLGRWILREACLQAASWPGDGRGEPPWVSVNMAAAQLAEPQMVDDLRDILAETKLPPHRLVLEITETAVVDAPESQRFLSAARELGVRLAMDDFGQGLSSLSRLRQLRLDILKLDRSFVDHAGTRADDRAIVESVVQLAYHLGMAVIAEGIESEDQCAALEQVGCPLAQGFLFARPLVPEAVVEHPCWPPRGDDPHLVAAPVSPAG